MPRWIQINGELVPAEQVDNRRPVSPAIITDSHEPFKSMADGKVYDSKSRYRRELKARGMIEVGNERVTKPESEHFSTASVEKTLREVMNR